ncbi:MAG: 4-(cytidine 5'-diphospho)-2-C-methyl-D-erythritol kinase [bacterium]
MKKVEIPAPAKINLALDIEGLREDGFHEVKMIMQSISLHDWIVVRKRKKGIKITSSESSLPDDSGNIAYRAANMILNKKSVKTGVDIFIEKNIPIGAGLAGGSTDAAAVLKAINYLYSLDISDKSLCDMASLLGSDVPFCLKGGTALAYGRGEKIDQLPDLDVKDLVLVNPGFEVSTPWAYNKYDEITITDKIPIESLLNILKTNKGITWKEGWGNVLEKVTITYYSEINKIKSILKDMGALFVMMSGSGPTVFAVVENQEDAAGILENWPRNNDFIISARTVKKDFSRLYRK